MTHPHQPPPPSPADVARIAAIPDRTLRNLEITHCYARLSSTLSDRFGPLANWCTFATWASRQAGSTIRGEDMLQEFERRVKEKPGFLAPLAAVYRTLLRKGLFEPESRLGRTVREIHTPFDAFERTSDAVAEGNLRVFEEIALAFARYLEMVPADAAVDAAPFDAFAAGLRPGPPPHGQDLLREAFVHYQQSHHESDPATQVALLLLANLKIGLHEQTRLQPQIVAALEAPLVTAEDLGRRVLHRLAPRTTTWSDPIQRPLAAVLRWGAGRLRAAAIQLTRETITASLMVLALPQVVLQLGHNLDAPVPDTLRSNPQPELKRFLELHDPCYPDVLDCAVADWGNLTQRMHFILHLFRAYAEEQGLFAPPFSDEQTTQFLAGVIPHGRL